MNNENVNAQQVTKKNAVLVVTEIRLPVNHERRDKAATNKFSHEGGKNGHKVNATIMKKGVFYRGNGKEALEDWPCVAEAKTWKGKVKNLLKKRTLDISLKGNSLMSVHQVDLFNAELNELASELSEIKQAYKDTLPEMKRVDQERFGEFYNDGLYPSESIIDSWGVKKIIAKITSDNFADVAEFVQEAEQAKVNRLVSQFESMVSAIKSYVEGDSKKFTKNSIESVIEEATLLKDFDFGSDSQDSFNRICDNVVELASGLNIPALREARNKLDDADAKEMKELGETKDYISGETEKITKGLDQLVEDCEGLF